MSAEYPQTSHSSPFLLSGLLDAFEAHMRASLTDLSPDQLRKWRNSLRRAIDNLIRVIGDKSIKDITRDDALNFRDWWQARITGSGLDISTANRDIGSLNRMFNAVCETRRLRLDPVFAKLRIAGGEDGQRTAFEREFVQQEILRDGVFDEINAEARRVLYLIAERGLRLSEATNLTRETIRLNCDVPPRHREGRWPPAQDAALSPGNPAGRRRLEAMKLQPDGFPRCWDKAAPSPRWSTRRWTTAACAQLGTIRSIRYDTPSRIA